MKRFLRVVATMALLAPSNAGALRVIVPADKALVRQDSVSVLGTAQRGSDVPWSIQGSRGSDQGIAKADWGDLFEVFFILDPGLNRLKVGDQELQIFFDAGGAAPPEGFAAQRVHAGDVSRCEECHDAANMSLREGGYPGACFDCHVMDSQNPDNREDPRKNAHFQTAVASCGRCHEAHVSGDSKLLKAGPAKQCGSCHEKQLGGAGVHPAYEEGGCAACHDPHYSGYPKILREPQPGLCQRCHDQGKAMGAEAHAPLTKPPSCSLCHQPHGAGGALLVAAGNTLCLPCHRQVLQQGHRKELESCASCHDPHGRAGTGLLKTGFASACSRCHDGVARGKTVHRALQSGCQACHDPHAADDVARARRSCGRCHDWRQNRELASMHGDLGLAEGSCSGCHPAHAAKQGKLVRGRLHYPLTQGKCSVCHGGGDERSVKVEKVATRCRMCHPFEGQMRARGERIHEPVASGECLACHDPHMSEGGALMRAPEGKICRECHDVAPPGSGAHPLSEACGQCHRAHGGKHPKFLSSPAPQL